MEASEEQLSKTTSESRYIRLGPVEDFAEGEMRISVAAGRDIGVVRWDGEFYAVRNICPHRGAPVCEGVVRPSLITDPDGSLEVVNDRPVLTCCWHRWEFDLRTGQALRDSLRLRTYPVSVGSDGEVIVDMGRRA